MLQSLIAIMFPKGFKIGLLEGSILLSTGWWWVQILTIEIEASVRQHKMRLGNVNGGVLANAK